MRLVLAVAVVASLMVGCAPAAGEACAPENGAACDGQGGAVFCESAVFVAYPCPGPLKCGTVQQGSSSGVSCDMSRSSPGAACPAAVRGRATCADSHTLIRCDSATIGPGHWSPQQCDGGCLLTATGGVACQ